MRASYTLASLFLAYLFQGLTPTMGMFNRKIHNKMAGAIEVQVAVLT